MMEKLKNNWPIFAIIGIVILVFYPLFIGKTFLHTGLVYTDLWLFNYPIKEWYRQMLLSGEFPFWTSLIGNGYPLFAEGQMGALYPLHLVLFRLLPTLYAFHLNIVIHFSLAALFTYLLGRKTLKLSKTASFLAAVAYAFSGYFVLHTHQINIDMVITYFPLSLYLSHKLVQKSARHVFVLAIVFALQILAGHIEMFYYSTILTFAFMVMTFLFRSKTRDKKIQDAALIVGSFGVAISLAVGITFIQLASTYELNSLSQRSSGIEAEEAAQSKWPLKSLLLFLHPRAIPIYELDEEYSGTGTAEASVTEVYVYIGLIPFLLAMLSLLKNRKTSSVIFGILLVSSLVYAFGRSTQFFVLLWQTLPGLKFFRFPTKIAFFIAFSLSVLAGLGYDHFSTLFEKRFKSKANFNYFLAAIITISTLDILIFNVFGTRKLIDAKKWLEPPPTATYLADKFEKPYNFRLYSHGTNNLDYDKARDFNVQLGVRNILPRDFNMIYGIPNNREWVVLFIERQTGLNQTRTSIDIENQQLGLPPELKKSLALQSVKYFVSDIPISDTDLTLIKKFPLSESLDHSFYVAAQNGEVGVVRIPTDGIYLYEWQDYIPRAYFIGDYQISEAADHFELQKLVLSESFNARASVMLEEPLPDSLAAFNGDARGKVEIVKDKQNEIEISVDANEDGFLVLHDTYYPGWVAYLCNPEQRSEDKEQRKDCEKKKIYRANYAFRAVQVPEGKSKVIMKFKPTYLKLGIIVSGVSLALTVGGLILMLSLEKARKTKK